MAKYDSKIKNSLIWKAFWEGIRPYQFFFWVSSFFFFAGAFAQVIVPIFYKRFFDLLETVERQDVVGDLRHTLYLIAAIHISIWIFYRLAVFISDYGAGNIMARLKQNSFNYIMLHSYGFFSNNFTGSLVQRINRFSRAYERLADTIFYQLIPLSLTALGAIIITWRESHLVSLVITGWVIFFAIFNFVFSRWKVKYDIASAAADSRTTGVLSDNIANQNAIALFTGYNYEISSFRDVTKDQSRKQILSWNLSSIVDSIQVLLIFVVEFAIFYWGVGLWADGELSVGTFVLFQVYVIGLAHQLWGMSRIIRNIYESMADSREIVEILALPHEIKDVPGATRIQVNRGEVEFRAVSFKFDQNKEVLKGFNLKINAGEKVALVGPSGAGKTTIVRLVLRLYDVTSGGIFVDGQDIGTVTQESLRENISLVPQDPVLFHRTLMDNIRYGRRDASDEEVMQAARLAHCDEFIENLPKKYETFVGERGIKLSGGERQRVAIARAILKNAPILILDEATSSLDSHSEALIQDALDTLMKGKTTIVIAHRLSTIRKMDRIVVIEEGKIKEQGSHDDLLKTEGGLYKKLWDLQAGGFIK